MHVTAFGHHRLEATAPWGLKQRKIFEAEDSDFGGGASVPGKCVLPPEWVPQVPRIWERETTDPKPTEADHDQFR